MNENKSTLRAAIAENPVLVLFLGACPAMAQTNKVVSALGIGAALLIVMLLSNLVIFALRRAVPASARIPASILIVTFFVSAVQLAMNALLPSVYQMLGVYLAVAAVNLMVFNSAERASSAGFGETMLDALLTGLGFALALFILAALREVLGLGTFAGISVPFFKTYNIPVLSQASGGFMVFAILAAVVNKLCSAKEPAAGKGFACTAAGLCEASKETEGND